jgi:YHS domain-containing protein
MKNLSGMSLFLAALGCVGLLAATPASAQRVALEKVQPKMVCMVNDTLFSREQIPVEVDGKTYFGCCEMCKGRLAKDTSIRSAKDPVSGASVDKALAVIGAAPDGSVQYFSSDETFSRYNQGS